MSLSKKHLSSHTSTVSFSVDSLSEALKGKCPEIVFAFLLGSSREGVVRVGSDIDIALFLDGQASLDLYHRVTETIENVAQGVHCDVGILNNAEPVYRFEALKGTLLFCHNQEAYLRFYSLACREYETQVFHYEKQHRYRILRPKLGTS